MSVHPAAAAIPPPAQGPPCPGQQPSWCQHPAFARVLEALATVPALVTSEEVMALSMDLARVAVGDGMVLQLGDCAESFHESTAAHMRLRLSVIERLADEAAAAAGAPVVRIGRLAGQYAKPRSEDVERHGSVELPAFRGHMINSEVPTRAGRQHEPRRMLWAYTASARGMDLVHRQRQERAASGAVARGTGPWSSHEALVLDYEHALARPDGAGRRLLGSTHLPWVGERTRHPDGAHVRLLAGVQNPVACKVGPGATPGDVLELCARLDPRRRPGRLVLIARMGHEAVTAVLPALVGAVRDAGHPVVWLSDPLHGNTVKLPGGLKTRYVDHVIAEVRGFRAVLASLGVPSGGLHLEVSPDPVTECIGLHDELAGITERYASLCDPRLNPEQARAVLQAWFA